MCSTQIGHAGSAPRRGGVLRLRVGLDRKDQNNRPSGAAPAVLPFDRLRAGHYDGLGSTRALTDANGNTSATYDYDVFGAIRSGTGNITNDFQYTGEQKDAESQYYFLRARYYDPGIGRFITQDPFGGLDVAPQTINPYVYVSNNAVNLVDPSGLAGEAPVLLPGKQRFAALEVGTKKCLFGFGGCGPGEVGGDIWAIIAALLQSGGNVERVVQASIREFGVRSYAAQQLITRGLNHLVEAHHIIPARFATLFEAVRREMPSVVLPQTTHQQLDQAINQVLKPGQQYTPDMMREGLIEAYQRVAPSLVPVVQSFFQR